MRKKVSEKLKASEFFYEVCKTVTLWDYYLQVDNRESAKECMGKWTMAKSALEYITGEIYGFSRNSEMISIVNERNDKDILFVRNILKEAILIDPKSDYEK